MKKELIRKEFFKLKFQGHSYSGCKIILKSKYNYNVTIRTLKRWMNRLDNDDDWDLKDNSQRPKRIYYKLNQEIENKVLSLRHKTGWGENQLGNYFPISSWSINKILISTT